MNTASSGPSGGRIAYFDSLRILAACSVVLLHVSAQNWDSVSLESPAWYVFNTANSATRWAVPVFLMLSGALFLDDRRPLDAKRLWTAHIPRIAAAFLFWSAVYALYRFRQEGSLQDAVTRFIEGEYHMWYLPTLAALYMVTPLLRRITEDKRLTQYFLAVAAFFLICIPRSLHLLECLDIPRLRELTEAAQTLWEDFQFGFGQIPLFYFVLGFYLFRYDLPAPLRRIIFILGIGGYCATVGLTHWFSLRSGAASTAFYSNSSFNVLCMSVAVFLLAKHGLSRLRLSPRQETVVRFLSGHTFGIYLVHPLVIRLLKDRLGLHTLSFHPIAALAMIFAAVLTLSLGITWLLRRIPLIRKYVV